MGHACEPGSSTTPAGHQVSLTIDRHPVVVASGSSVLEAARAAGVALPDLCAGGAGTCRLCLVEIDAHPGTPASCTTPARSGMVVRTRTALLGQIRRGVVELALSEHVSDCPICSDGGRCDLIALATETALRPFARGGFADAAASTREPAASLDPPDHAAVTTCTGCGLGCAFRAERQDGAAVRLTPFRHGDLYTGRSCRTGRLAWGSAQHSERIVRPMIRVTTADPWREVSWEAALSHVAAEFRRIQRDYGRRAVGAVTAATSTNEEAFLTHKLVRAGFGNNNVDSLGRPRGSGPAEPQPATFPHEFSGYRHVSDAPTRQAFEAVWGAPLDAEPGLGFSEMLAAAQAGVFRGLLIQGEDVVLTRTGPTAAALAAMDCVVVQDTVLGETGRFAHVFLPGSTFLEKDGTVTDLDCRIRRIRRMMAPRSGLADWEITQGLAAAFGYTMAYADPGRVLDEIAATTPTFAGVSFAALDAFGAMRWPSSEGTPGDLPARPLDDTGQRRLRSDTVEPAPLGEPERDDGPLLLTTGPSSRRLGVASHARSTCPLRWHEEDCLEMHPDDARKRGLRTGDWVKLESAAGETLLYLDVTGRVAPGIVAATVNLTSTVSRIVPSDDAERDARSYTVTPVEVSASSAPSDGQARYEDWWRNGRMD